MKHEWLKYNSFADLIVKFNPFGFKEEDGSSMVFRDYGELYKYTLKTLFAQFPRGYIDLPLFVHLHTKMPLRNCVELVRTFRNMKMISGVYLIKYWDEDDQPKMKFALILQGLHTISNTPFNQSYFDEAWRQCEEDLEKIKAAERIEDGTMVNAYNPLDS